MNYQVEIKEVPFELENGIILNKTAIVTIYDDNQEESSQELWFGYADVDILYSHREQWMEFKTLYFNEFSIRDYRRVLRMENSYTVYGFNADKCFFDGDTDFSKMIYGEGGFSISHSYFSNGTVNFQDSTFNSEITTFGANIYGDGIKDFSATKFYGNDVQFFSSQFNNGDLNFKCSHFEKANLTFSGSSLRNGNVNFDFSRFSSKGVDFSGVDFCNGETSFRNANFNGGRALFFGSSFKKGKVSFSEAVFGDSDLDFSYCNFGECQVHFKYTKIGQGSINMSKISHTKGSMLFKGIHFKCKNSLFLDSKIQSLIFLNSTFSEHVNLQLSQCDELIIKNCIIEKTFDLISSDDHKINIRSMDLTSTKNLGRIYIDWALNDVKNMIYTQKGKSKYIDKANQFRLLKENFHDIGQYDDEDYAYVEFKRCQSISQIMGEDLADNKKNKLRMLSRYLVFPIKWFIFDFIGNYATKPMRILGSILISILVFSCIYSLPFIELGGTKNFYHNEIVNRITNGLYHSIQSTFTLGYGDVNPNNLATLLISGMESFIGVFLMSYFTAAFVRKLLR